MARAIWSGSITFGLVNVPVKLVTAVRDKSLRFNLLHDKDKVRLRRKLVCPADDEEVPQEHQVHGYQVSPDQYVVVTEEEIESLQAPRRRTIEITSFADLEEIDPIYFDQPYYLVPEELGLKAYALLLQAMQREGKIGLGKMVLHSKEHLVALRPLENLICLEILHFADEVVPAPEAYTPPRELAVEERDRKMAQQLIEAMSGEFTPEDYHDEYREAMAVLIQRKAEGKEIVTPPRIEEAGGEVISLTEALRASLAERKQKARKKKAA